MSVPSRNLLGEVQAEVYEQGSCIKNDDGLLKRLR
jgi:hypothetical protein